MESSNENHDYSGMEGGDDSNPQDGALSNSKVWDETEPSAQVPSAAILCDATAPNDAGTVVKRLGKKERRRIRDEGGDENNVQDRIKYKVWGWDVHKPDWQAKSNVCNVLAKDKNHSWEELWSNPNVSDETDPLTQVPSATVLYDATAPNDAGTVVKKLSKKERCHIIDGGGDMNNVQDRIKYKVSDWDVPKPNWEANLMSAMPYRRTRITLMRKHGQILKSWMRMISRQNPRSTV